MRGNQPARPLWKPLDSLLFLVASFTFLHMWASHYQSGLDRQVPSARYKGPWWHLFCHMLANGWVQGLIKKQLGSWGLAQWLQIWWAPQRCASKWVSEWVRLSKGVSSDWLVSRETGFMPSCITGEPRASCQFPLYDSPKIYVSLEQNIWFL